MNNIYYFTKEHEDAILRYCASSSQKEKEMIYMTLIQPVFSEMVDKIVYTYKFNSLQNIDILRLECKNWLMTILDKFDPNKGYKAFAYFSVIVKNWFIQITKKQNRNSKEITIENTVNPNDLKHLVTYNMYEQLREDKEFWEAFQEDFKKWKKNLKKPNEIAIYDAIMLLFENIDIIEIFNKKAIYIYMKEITNLKSKQIATNIKKFKIRYENFKRKWDNGEI